MENMELVKIHTLRNGATILPLSPGHGFKFSDGTECGPQVPALCSMLTLDRQVKHVKTIKGMPVNKIAMTLRQDQIAMLRALSAMADLVMVPFPVLTAIREDEDQNLRQELHNIVAFNATEGTQRSAPAEKVVDINNWSY